MSKFPKLTNDILAPGVSYPTAYCRLLNGWDFARAVSEPPKKRALPATSEQRGAAYDARRARSLRARLRYERIRAKEPIAFAPDTVPAHIKELRDAYCVEFIKKGTLNPALFTKLKGYADECKSAKIDPIGVPREPEAANYREEGHCARVDGDPNAHPTPQGSLIPARV